VERDEVKSRVDELMRQLADGEIDRAAYVDGIEKLQVEARDGGM